MPSCTVADQHGMSVRGDHCTDLAEVLVHRFGVDRRHYDGGTDGALGTNGTEEVDGVMAVVAHHRRARTDRCPDIGVSSLLTDSGLILEPDLDRLAGGGLRQGLGDQAAKVFLKAACAAGSFLGWNGRGCSRVSFISRSQTPMVFPCTVTEKRRFTSSRRSTQRQSTTRSVSGSGPFTAKASSSALCAQFSEGFRPELDPDFRSSIPKSL